MIKRLKYISRQTREIDLAELNAISAISKSNNLRSGVTGLLVKVGDYFFQILEGPPDAVDLTYERIQRDDRHGDVVVVAPPELVPERLFAKWSMRVEFLDPLSEERLEPIGHMLTTVVELIQKSADMAAVLQRSLLYELRTRDQGPPTLTD